MLLSSRFVKLTALVGCTLAFAWQVWESYWVSETIKNMAIKFLSRHKFPIHPFRFVVARRQNSAVFLTSRIIFF